MSHLPAPDPLNDRVLRGEHPRSPQVDDAYDAAMVEGFDARLAALDADPSDAARADHDRLRAYMLDEWGLDRPALSA